MNTPTITELAALLGIPAGSVGRLRRQGHIRYEGGRWIVERPQPGRKKGEYGKGLKAEKVK